MTPDKVLDYLKDWIMTSSSDQFRGGTEPTDYLRGWEESKKNILRWIEVLEKDNEDE